MGAFVRRRLDENGKMEKLNIRELFGKKKGVLVGVPGAFTPACSKIHLPEFVDKSGVLAAKVRVRRLLFPILGVLPPADIVGILIGDCVGPPHPGPV